MLAIDIADDVEGGKPQEDWDWDWEVARQKRISYLPFLSAYH